MGQEAGDQDLFYNFQSVRRRGKVQGEIFLLRQTEIQLQIFSQALNMYQTQG